VLDLDRPSNGGSSSGPGVHVDATVDGQTLTLTPTRWPRALRLGALGLGAAGLVGALAEVLVFGTQQVGTWLMLGTLALFLGGTWVVDALDLVPSRWSRRQRATVARLGPTALEVGDRRWLWSDLVAVEGRAGSLAVHTRSGEEMLVLDRHGARQIDALATYVQAWIERRDEGSPDDVPEELRSLQRRRDGARESAR